MKRIFLIATILTSFFLFLTLSSFNSRRADGLVTDILAYTNEFRKSKGKPALLLNADLNAIAQTHSANMASGKTGFGHAGFNEREKLAAKKLSSIHSFAENVAYGPSTGREVVNMWKKSSGHRKNMLGKFKYMGIGTARDRRGVIYYTQVFAN